MLSLVSVLFAQTTGGPASFDWSTIVVNTISGIPVAGVLLWQLHLALKKIDERDAEIRELHAAHRDEIRALQADNRAMTERVAVALAESTRTLLAATEGLESTVNRARPPAEDLARQMRRIEQLIRDNDPGQKRGGPR